MFATLEGRGRRGPAPPLAITKLIQRLVSLGDPCETLRAQIPTPYGVHRLNAQRLFAAGSSPGNAVKDTGGCLVALSIDLHEHPIAHAARILRLSGATPAQVEVGVKLAWQIETKIADELLKKEASIVDLTKKLYATLGVHNSAELCAKIWLSAMHERSSRTPPWRTRLRRRRSRASVTQSMG